MLQKPLLLRHSRLKTSSSIRPLRLWIWLTFHIYYTWYFPYNHQEVSTRSILNVIHKSIPIVVSIVSCTPIWPPITHFLKDLGLAGFPQTIPQKVWSFRAWRKLFPEWFGISCCKDMKINGSA